MKSVLPILKIKRQEGLLKISKIKSLGNLKFIEDDEKNIKKSQKKLISYFKNRNVWVASSTHQYEKILCKHT